MKIVVFFSVAIGTPTKLFCDLDPELKTWLDDTKARNGVSLRALIEALVRHSMKMEETELSDLLRGTSVTVTLLGEVLEALMWANHAESKGHYDRALLPLTSLERVGGESIGLARLISYKQGYDWFEIGALIRLEAINTVSGLDEEADRAKSWDQYYEATFDALKVAAYYFKQFKDTQGPLSSPVQLPVAHYNLACIHSMKALYMIEAPLINSGRFNLVEQLAEMLRYDSCAGDVKFWEQHGNTWPEWFQPNTAKALIRDVEAELRQSQEYLARMVSIARDFDPSLNVSDLRFLINRSRDDVDLRLLWSYTNSESSEEYFKWLNNNRSGTPMMSVFRNLRARIPESIKIQCFLDFKEHDVINIPSPDS
ncbi:MAG: hypothetical protein ACLQRM_02460 [Acidimicrobiales bacterium]